MVVRPMIEIKLNYIRDELFAFIINIPTGIFNSGRVQLRQFITKAVIFIFIRFLFYFCE